jgi:hypothetical protein
LNLISLGSGKSVGRKRKAVVRLPEGVEKKTVKGRTYFYWNPGRGTAREGRRIRLPNLDNSPAAFFKELELYTKPAKPVPLAGSVSFLVQSYRNSEDFKKLSESTKASYSVHLNRFEIAWGTLPYELPPGAVIALRDSLADTPGMANHMLSVGRTLWKWGRSIGSLCDPFLGVAKFDVGDVGHIPWPAWVIELVCRTAWPDLVRMVRLGLATCQRESDLIRMGPAQRERHGLWCRPKKTKKRRKAFNIPLTLADARMLDRWPQTEIAFTATRWKAPIRRGNSDFYLFSPRGVAYTETSLRARWHRWLKTEDGKIVCERWKAWVAAMVRKYEWEIDFEQANYPTIHGLRGAGILIRRAAGHDIDQIANDIGMSRQMVERYMRFRDQMEVAAGGQARLRVIR